MLLSLTVLSLGFAPATSLADTAEEINALPVLDPLNRIESPLSNEGKWSALSWAMSISGHATGRDEEGGWGPDDIYSLINGAYWSPASFSGANGSAAAITMQNAPGFKERYVSLWLDMANPGSTKSGYQLRWCALAAEETYKVTLSKWSSGIETIIAEQASIEIPTETTMAISDIGSTVTGWASPPEGSLNSILSASDSTYSSGYAGVEGSGNASRSEGFKAGTFKPEAPDTTITAGPKGINVPSVSFSFTASEQGASFECSLDGTVYGTCTSPKAYQGLSEGPHTFRVRATGAGGSDATPAERSFQVIQAVQAVANTPILDNFEREEVPLETGKWSKSSWVGEIGGAWMGGYRGYGSNGGLEGAYWNQAKFSDGGETILVAGNVGTGSPYKDEYLSLWLDMPEPGSARSGYEARFTGVNGSASNYKVELSKWVAGTRTILASTSGFSLAVGTPMALTETSGGNLALWTGTSSLSPVLTANDSTYTGGYVGLEVNGPAGTIYNLRAGALASPLDTTITAGPKGINVPSVSFSFTASEQGASFECSLDGTVYGACTSPKAYQGLSEGPHTFRVRATGAGGSDATPAERSFQVVQAAKAVAKVPILDNFERQEVPLATGKWSKSGWAGQIGGAWMGSYRGYGSSGGLASAYWNPSGFADNGETVLVAGSVGTGAAPENQYLSLWLDMPEPGSARSGYEARFTGVNGSASNYKVELSKWVAGTRTILASTSGFSLAVGTPMALTETSGGNLALWTGTSSLSPVLTANDSTYTGGYVGLEVNGPAGTIYNFRAGRIDIQPPDTTIASGPSGTVVPEEVTFSFTSTESGSSFECSLDGAAYGACSSPKSYQGIASGSRSFRVRAADAVGNQDATPAERSFSVAPPPSATTGAATSVAAGKATLNASINPNGVSTTYQFEYGTTTSYGSKVPASSKSIGAGSSNAEVSELLTGLQAGTVYHFRISATNGSGTKTGEDRTFTTAAAPVAATEMASNVSAKEATLNASVNPKGAATTYQFNYGLTTSYGATIPIVPKSAGSGTGEVSISETLTNLEEGNTYHYRIVAENEVGTTLGADRSFTTPLLAEAETKPAQSVEANEAVLSAAVDPNGEETTYQFEYGTSTAYGTTEPAAPEEIQSNSDANAAEQAVAFLQPETTYHYRVVAKSDAGVVYGADHTLTTSERTMTAAAEAQAAAEEVGEAELASPPPSDFINMMWSGENGLELQSARMRAIKKSGSTYLRHSILWEKVHPGGSSTPNWSFYEALFKVAAEKDITILPDLGGNPVAPEQGFPTPSQGYTAWNQFINEVVQKFGPNGSFWSQIPAEQRHPVEVWEVGNENNYGQWNYHNEVNPEDFGAFLKDTSDLIKAWHPNSKVILGGLLSVGTEPGEAKMTVGTFLEKMQTGRNSFNYLGLHPYAFKIKDESYEGAPRGPKEVRQLTKKIRANVQAAHAALRNIGRENVRIWITELGFPVETWDGSHPKVNPTVQGELVTSALTMLKAQWERFGIRAIFYYNDHDINVHEWAYHCGLQALDNHYRPAWYRFLEENGQPKWPKNPRLEVASVQAVSSRAEILTDVDAYGSPTSIEIKFGESNSYGTAVTQDAGSEEGVVSREVELPNLTPDRTYHYKVIAANENGEGTETTDQTFRTEQNTVTTGTFDRSLNGEPGWVYLHGWLKHDQVGINGVHVNVNFYKENPITGVFEYTNNTQQSAVINGQWHVDSVPLARGTWEWRAAFNGPEQGYPESWSSNTGTHPSFVIKNGYHLINQNSSKCLEVSYGSSEDGMSIHQEPCGDGHTAQAQTFTLVPSPSNPVQYEIVNRNSGKCLDVKEASQANGAQIIQYTCLGWGHVNQIFEGAPNSSSDTSHVHFTALHSSKCLDIPGSSTENGALLQQWSCNGTGAQSFGFESVEADPVPTHTYLTLDPTLSLYGHPGYETFHGTVESPQSVTGQKVYINFKKWNGSNYVYEGNQAEATLGANGEYKVWYQGVGAGNWEAITIYPGSGNTGESRSPEGSHTFHIGDGYRFEFRQSNKCVSTYNGETTNGTWIIQWDCKTAYNPYDGQVYSVKPMAPAGSNYFEIIPDSNTNMCLDVTGGPGATQNGATVQLWQCLGEGQANQIWHIVELASPNNGWFASIAKHSGRCMTVNENSTANGARFLQWDCAWAGSQQWRWLPVG